MRAEQIHKIISCKKKQELQASPRKTRVQYKKYINQLNDTLQALITTGKQKRMELITINNRALFNRAKVQRSQWIARKYTSNLRTQFSPDTYNLKLDSRLTNKQCHMRIATDTQQTKINNRYFDERSSEKKVMKTEKDSILDRLIDEQILKIKQNKLLRSTLDRKRIVKNACKQIEDRLILDSIPNKKIRKTGQSLQSSTWKMKKNPRKNHQRSVTHNLYQTSLQEINKKQEIQKKERQSARRQFIRKLKKTKPMK